MTGNPGPRATRAGEPRPSLREALPDLGVVATVMMNRETEAPRVWNPGADLREIEGDEADGQVVSDLRIVSHWSAHVMLYALQNPSRYNIERALDLICASGDFDDWSEDNQTIALVQPPPGWRERP